MFTIMSSLDKIDRIEVVSAVQRRQRWTLDEKLALVQQTFELSNSVSLVARKAGVATSQLFQWRKTYTEVSLVVGVANEPVVPASQMQDALKRIPRRQYCNSSSPSALSAVVS